MHHTQEDLLFVDQLPVRIQTPALRAEILAAKFQAAADRKALNTAGELASHPGIAGLLRFVLWLSHQTGGLDEWAKAAVRRQAHLVGPASLHAPGDDWDDARRLQVVRETRLRFGMGDSTWAHVESVAWPADEVVEDVLIVNRSGEDEDRFNLRPVRAARRGGESWQAEFARRVTWQTAWRECAKSAVETLPRDLARVINEPNRPLVEQSAKADSPEGGRGPFWYLAGIMEFLEAELAWQRAQALGSIASTEVSRALFEQLDFASQERQPVQMLGHARMGKTDALRAYCAAHPDRFRLVTVPESQRDADLVQAHAKALGIPVELGGSITGLREAVEFTLRHGGFLIAYDEAHFMWPPNPGQTSIPRRLNWIRANVVDAGAAAAFVSTPQSYIDLPKRLVRRAGYSITQWVGRVGEPVHLPDSLSAASYRAIVSRHLPELPDKAAESAVKQLMAARKTRPAQEEKREIRYANPADLLRWLRRAAYELASGRATTWQDATRDAAWYIFGNGKNPRWDEDRPVAANPSQSLDRESPADARTNGSPIGEPPVGHPSDRRSYGAASGQWMDALDPDDCRSVVGQLSDNCPSSVRPAPGSRHTSLEAPAVAITPA